MSEARIFTVRPLAKQPRSDLRESFRVYLSPTSLAYLKLSPGNVCLLHVEGAPGKTAIAWNAVGDIKNTVVQASSTLQDCYGIKLGDKLTITKVETELKIADRVQLQECTSSEKLSKYGPLSSGDKGHWEWSIEFPLLQCEILAVGLGFDIELKGQRRSFKIVDISTSGAATQTISRFTERSAIKIGDDVEIVENPVNLEVKGSGLGGLSRQISKLNQILVDFNSEGLLATMPGFYRPNRGILIYGPKGTGKSSLLQRIQSAGWKNTFVISSNMLDINSSGSEGQLRQIFKDASFSQPSVVIIDQIESIAPKRMSREAFSLAHALSECIDSLGKDKVLVVAATRHPNNVDDALRTAHRLGVEVEISVPTATARREILLAIRDGSAEPSDALINLMAEKTHGYVGADLFALLQISCRRARDRLVHDLSILNPKIVSHDVAGDAVPDATPLTISEDDITQAMLEIRPTAMREVFLETPKVRWSDIGGQQKLKKHLRKVIERPLKFPEKMQRLNVRSKKGVLLYGPPGCSKTLIAKALATEAGLNFLAVRGAEILNQYVGESERALRDIFQKARGARPSIIFFDEIDAIAAKRTGSHGGVNVLTTLLNEMDGIEELRNVLVVAATNKPDVLDPALMRPGRLDNIVYVGPPDFAARKEIFTIWMGKSVISPDVDIDELAAKTEGYSGAEIISLCETAGEAALDDEDESGQSQDIMRHHFDSAFERVKSQLTSEIILEYEQWSKLSAF
ncbi:putative AAA family ATPase [Talaromyces proteolyticus]|uniref:AAA family ATPase n=1 Tax=Talaromyces proteolyticus TaxID=1131652 RepID=A0AAD4PW35_9EURO|nr:putative AAA family ATPase [Talaromyces proteolyticus]KAH8690985.1 putative AAA family ATPase [Talaromyces proteolyticus]